MKTRVDGQSEVFDLLSNPGARGSEDAAEPLSARCSFCNKYPGDVGSLIEGPGFEGLPPANICAECVAYCSSIFEQVTRASNPDALKEKLDRVLKPLTDLERQVICLVHGLTDGYTYTFEEVGQRLKIKTERVQEIEAEAIAKLKSQTITDS